MSLAKYRAKRDFTATREPAGEREAADPGDSFVVQKHDARRLHYDFRLEMDGVLKSWAVAKGPSLVPREKRLAVHVEDHPLEYGGFEGTIPKGQYGGGTVIVWDRGTWRPIGDAAKGYAKGHLDFELSGEKLRGRWHLVRMAGKAREKHENWLLIKGDDESARKPTAADILEERPESVKTGRVIAEVAEAPDAPQWDTSGRRKEGVAAKRRPAARGGGKRKRGAGIAGAGEDGMPEFVSPALATLKPKAPAGARWLHEIKFDGYRVQARLADGAVRLSTRSGLDWSRKFGTAIVDALQRLHVASAILDGEVVVETAHGVSDFSALQADLSDGREDRLVYYLFDLLYLDGQDLRAVKLVERKAKLEALLQGAPPVLRYSAHFTEPGALILEHACRLSLEGVVSKLKDGAYVSGRGNGWVKSKCNERQEFVIGGYVPSSTGASAIGSLVLGVYDGKKLHHAGRVGTGFTVKVAADLFRRLDKLGVSSSPFSDKLSADAARQVRFVRPELVAEVEFRGWTAERSVRHASFRGLREDRDPSEVKREDDSPPVADPPRVTARLTHPDRIYWPEAGVTKAGLADYYAEAWRWMAPFVAGRPLALVRCPSGLAGQCFFQKHAWQGIRDGVRLVTDPADPSGEKLLTVDGLDGVVALVQAGVLEIHPWGSTVKAIEQPDFMTLDLDPGEGVTWDMLIGAAEEIRARLARQGVTGFVKTSGGKGLHVVAPLIAKAGWTEVKAYTKRLAEEMAADAPGKYVATITKAKRKGKILIDYLRNGRGATAVAPYSTRARPIAGVSMPLAWDELAGSVSGDHFTVANAGARIAALARDPWEDFKAAAVALPALGARRR